MRLLYLSENMTPTQKIMREILLIAAKEDGFASTIRDITEETIDDKYAYLCDLNRQYDIEDNFRQGEVETNIPCKSSRHYESKSVASKLSDGSYVGWTFWYGGGEDGRSEGGPVGE